MIRPFFLTVLFSLLLCSSEISIFGTQGLNQLQNDPEKFLGIIDCGEYTSYKSNSSNLFLKYNYLFNDNIGSYLSIGYNKSNFIYENTNKFSTRSDISIQEVTTINKVDFNLDHYTIGLGFSYRFEDFITGPFRIDLGGNYLIAGTSNFDQKEEIMSPDNATFIQFNNSQVRNMASGEITTFQSSINLDMAFINYIKLGSRALFNQSVGLNYQLNSSFQGAVTKVIGVNIGLGFTYDLRSQKPSSPIQEIKSFKVEDPEPEKEIVKEEVVIEEKPLPTKPELELQINTKWEDESIIESGEELLATLPLVNSVFFEKNSSEIPKDYIDPKVPDNYYFGDAVEVHKNVISRIENTLKKNQNATIEILGYSAGNDNEENALLLAKERAENLKSLISSQGIDQFRISTRSSLLPSNPTSMTTPEGIKENMRADIILKNAQFQEFVALQNFQNLRGQIDCQVKFKNIENLNLRSDLSDSIVAVDKNQSYSFEIDHRIADRKSIDYSVELYNDDTSIVKTGNLNILNLDKKNEEYDLSRFEAVLRFDFNSSQLSSDNKKLLSQLVERLPEKTKIQILGSADNLGNSSINKALEESRAKNTSDYLRFISGNKFEITTDRTKQKFPEDSPQGRFLNRSIRIRVTR